MNGDRRHQERDSTPVPLARCTDEAGETGVGSRPSDVVVDEIVATFLKSINPRYCRPTPTTRAELAHGLQQHILSGVPIQFFYPLRSIEVSPVVEKARHTPGALLARIVRVGKSL